MHKDDQMTPNERMEAFVKGKEFDRIPAMPFLDSIACRFAGMSIYIIFFKGLGYVLMVEFILLILLISRVGNSI